MLAEKAVFIFGIFGVDKRVFFAVCFREVSSNGVLGLSAGKRASPGVAAHMQHARVTSSLAEKNRRCRSSERAGKTVREVTNNFLEDVFLLVCVSGGYAHR